MKCRAGEHRLDGTWTGGWGTGMGTDPASFHLNAAVRDRPFTGLSVQHSPAWKVDRTCPNTGSVRLHHRSQMKQDSQDVAILNLPVKSSPAGHSFTCDRDLREDPNLAHSFPLLCEELLGRTVSVAMLPSRSWREGCGGILCKTPE